MSSSVTAPIPVRRMDLPFDDPAIARHWFGGSALATHLANGLNLVFPLGERFFVRSVRYYLDRVEGDRELRARLTGFFGQEAAHAREHERYFRVLESQGYDIRRFLDLYERIAYELIEPLAPPKLRLSVTVALEHFTATLAGRALSRDMLDAAPAAIRELFRWHAAEEIEHKSVAFDVLEHVDSSYGLRVAGLTAATMCLLGFWTVATVMLLEQDRDVTKRRLLGELLGALRSGHLPHGELLKSFLVYLRPGFHPTDIDNVGMAKEYLARIGRLEG